MEKRKSRIIFTVTNDLNFDQRMHRICTSLHENGYEVLLVGRTRKSSLPLESRPYRQKRLTCFWESGPLFYLEFNLRLLIFLLSQQTDVYVAIDLDTLLPNTFAGLVKSRKRVYDAHEYYTEVPELSGRPVVRSLWELVAWLCIPQQHVCYTVSHSLAVELSVRYKKTFELIRNVPVLHNRQELTEKTTKPVLLYQGDLNEGRGLELYISVMSSMDAELRIAGDGPLRTSLEEQVNRLGLKNKVRFLGYLGREALERETAMATVGLNLLENNSKSYYLSLSNKFFNYMHAGIPQVCVAFPEYQHIQSEFEVAVWSGYNETELKNVLHQLVQDESLQLKLKRNCAAASKVFNWQHEEQKLLAIYRGIC